MLPATALTSRHSLPRPASQTTASSLWQDPFLDIYGSASALIFTLFPLGSVAGCAKEKKSYPCQPRAGHSKSPVVAELAHIREGTEDIERRAPAGRSCTPPVPDAEPPRPLPPALAGSRATSTESRG